MMRCALGLCVGMLLGGALIAGLTDGDPSLCLLWAACLMLVDICARNSRDDAKWERDL